MGGVPAALSLERLADSQSTCQATLCLSAKPLFSPGRAWSRCQCSEGVGRTEACVVLAQAILHAAAPDAKPTALSSSSGPPSSPLDAGNQCFGSKGYRLQGLEEDRK